MMFYYSSTKPHRIMSQKYFTLQYVTPQRENKNEQYWHIKISLGTINDMMANFTRDK